MGRRVAWTGATAAVAALIGAAPAAATLGRPLDSVEQDRIHVAARAVATSTARGYRIHALTLANTGRVREFAGADGIVFAVAWAGPARPDLRQLLGDSFPVMQAARARPRVIARRAPLAVDKPGLVVRSLGHPGGFFGFAYLPASLPAGFPLDALR